ncbi:TonB-dependent receptor [Tenacibaculum sp. TC6]|uniref:TonB-dependent receptor n=1 Tax=Tenacibaculum sp. TC6 TaxID=3423223 RepID=UPI003D35A184
MRFRIYVLLISILSLYANHLFAQEVHSKEIVLLRDFLTEIETKHNVKFSYNDLLLKNKYVDTNINGVDLKKILDEISNQTNLNFEIIQDRYIIISEKTEKNSSNHICGFIYDSLTKEPIEEANITIYGNNKGISSNQNGFFKLQNLKDNDIIEITFVGYVTEFLNVKDILNKVCINVYLKHENTVLDEVLISDYLSGGIDKKSDGSVVISPQKLGSISGLVEPDVLQTIQLLPGINSPNETASDLFIRGGTPEQNLILFDGIKMYNSSHFFGMISAFNPYIINKVKIFKSGTSSEYGNHTSGVIDIETSKEIPTRIQGGFGANMTHFDAFLNVPLGKKIGITVSGRRSFTDFYKSTTFNRLSKKVFQNSVISKNQETETDSFEDTNDFYFFDVNSKITYNLSSKDVLTFNYLLVRNKLTYIFKTKDSDTYFTKDFLEIKNAGWRLKWDHKWSDNVVQNTSFYSSEYDFSYTYNGEFNFGQSFTQDALKSNLIKDFGFKTTIENKINDKTTFFTGYELVNNDVSYKIHRGAANSTTNIFYTIEDANNNNTHALFFNYGYNNRNKTIFNLGVRTNYFTLADKVYLAPRVYFQQQLFPKFSVKTSFEYKQQSIGQIIENHTSDFGLENQVWLLIDNKELPILRNNQYTLGFLYKSNGTIFDIDFYRKNSYGVTSFTRGTDGSVRSFFEGTGKVNGVDVLLKKSYTNYDTWINYSYSKSTYTFEEANNGQPFPGNFDITNSFLWAHNLKFGNFSFSLAWLLKTGTPYSPPRRIENNGTIVFGELNSRRLPAYHKIDVSSSYEFNFDKKKRWKGKVGISLLNIYDRTNILSRRYTNVSNGNSYSVQEMDNLSLGFTPNVVFRVFLK